MNQALIDGILSRRSCRAYTPEPVSRQQLETIALCGINAPSGMNYQPWQVVVVTDQALLKEINDETEAEVLKADPEETFEEGESIFYGAPAAFFVCAPEDGNDGLADCGMLTQNLCLAAHGLGLGSCVIGMIGPALEGPRGAELIGKIGAPEGFRPIYAVIVGHPAEFPEAKPRDAGKVIYR